MSIIVTSFFGSSTSYLSYILANTNLANIETDNEKWAWEFVNNILKPVTTLLPALNGCSTQSFVVVAANLDAKNELRFSKVCGEFCG